MPGSCRDQAFGKDQRNRAWICQTDPGRQIYNEKNLASRQARNYELDDGKIQAKKLNLLIENMDLILRRFSRSFLKSVLHKHEKKMKHLLEVVLEEKISSQLIFVVMETVSLLHHTVDMETRCMWFLSKTRLEPVWRFSRTKPATSASPQQGPESSHCLWQRLNARRFAQITLQA
ncbi:uncharacterized [Tachysurus ichikawai]